MNNTLRVYLKPILAGLCLAGLIVCIVTGYALLSRGNLIPNPAYPTANFTKFPIPTYTIQSLNTLEGKTNPTKTNNDEISIGGYVQIIGTGGVGLKIRLEPGTAGVPQFIAMENEVFQVKDGPVIEDSFTWWFLVAPYDNNRQGWAAGSYLMVITNP